MIPKADAMLVRITTGVALVAALVVATSLPAAYYAFDRRYHSGRLEAIANSDAELIHQIIARDPTYWRFQKEHLEQILARQIEGDREVHHVLDAEGDIVAQYPEDLALPGPLVEHSVVLLDAGHEVGRLRIVRSMRRDMLATGAIASVALLLAAVIFYGVRWLPLRALRVALNRASHLASHDPLTGLPNRTLFADRLAQTIAQLGRRGDHAAILFIDLDHFKDVNDTLGHAAGDQLLQEVALRIQKCLRKTDTLARLGGDEFAVIQGGIRQPETAANQAQRIIDVLKVPFDLDDNEVLIGVSIGIALASDDHSNASHLLRSADLALYRAKGSGRGNYRFFEEEMNEQLLTRKALERELRQAFAEEQFRVYFQPQIELATRRLIGVEALLRWHHPERGIIYPGEFISVAEEIGLIGPLGEWVLRRACLEMDEFAPLNVAVNLSPAQFRQPGLARMVGRVLNETGFDPCRLELEITEGILLQDTEATLTTLQQIKALKVRIAMDDFGTGYSSLSYLRRFPFDKLKIDRSFVTGVEKDEHTHAIIRAIVALGHSLGMKANAEGVEEARQADFLEGEGCDEVQGYYFGKPMPIANIRDLVAGISEQARGVPDAAAGGGEAAVAALEPYRPARIKMTFG